MTSTSKNTGFVVALICGLLGLLAFFALPFMSFGALGGVTSLQMATLGAQYSGAFALFWVEAVLAALIALVAALQFSKSASVSRKKAAGGWLLAFGIIGALLCIVMIVILGSASYNGYGVGGFAISLLGLGFWAFFLAVIGTIVGGIMAMRQAGQVVSVPGPSMSSPYTQYPPSQQTPPPPIQQYPPYQQPSSPQYPPYQQPSSGQYPPYQQPSSGQYPPYSQPSSPYPPQDYPPASRQ